MSALNKINLPINEQTYNYAKIYASLIQDEYQRKRAYASLVALYSFLNIIEKTSYNVQKSMTLFRNPLINEEYEISDLYVNNWHLDIRIITDGNAVLVPKKHYDCGIVPDYYVVIKVDSELKTSELLGFANTKEITPEAFNYNYSIIPIASLITYENFLDKVKTPKTVTFDPKEHELLKDSLLGIMDNDINPVTRNKILKHLFDCSDCRTEFCCFTGFEMVNCNISKYPDILNDQTLGVIGAQEVNNSRYEGKEEKIYIEDIDEINNLQEQTHDDTSNDNENNTSESNNEPEVTDILDELFQIEENDNDDYNINVKYEDKQKAEENNNIILINDEKSDIAQNTDADNLLDETSDSNPDSQKVIVDYDEFGEPIYSYITNVNKDEIDTIDTELVDIDENKSESIDLLDDSDNMEIIEEIRENFESDDIEHINEPIKELQNDNMQIIEDIQEEDTPDTIEDIIEELPSENNIQNIEDITVESNIDNNNIEEEIPNENNIQNIEDITVESNTDNIQDIDNIEEEIPNENDIQNIEDITVESNTDNIQDIDNIEDIDDDTIDSEIVQNNDSDEEFVSDITNSEEETVSQENDIQNIEESFDEIENTSASISNNNEEYSEEDMQTGENIEEEFETDYQDPDIDNFSEEETDETEENFEEYPQDEENEESSSKNNKNKITSIIILCLILSGFAIGGATYFIKHSNNSSKDLQTNNVIETQNIQNNNDMFEQESTENTQIQNEVTSNENSNNITIEQQPVQEEVQSPVQENVTLPPLTEQDLTSKPSSNGDLNKALVNAFPQSINSVSIRGVNWFCASELFTDKTFKLYLQDLDNKLKQNLKKNILNATETPQLDSVTAKFAVDNNGNLQKVIISNSCGSEEIDNIVLQSIKESFEGENSQILKDNDLKSNMYYLKVVIKL